MSENKYYMAQGEEAVRGEKEIASVAFMPLLAIPDMKFEPKDAPRPGMRGAENILGNTAMRRYSRAWSGSLDYEMYSESGSVKGGYGTIIKHFNGKATSTQNATTGQYIHMSYPVVNPYAAANLGTKALTLSENANEGETVKNHPWVGGRVKALSFVQEPGDPLKFTVDYFGQYRDALDTAIASPVYPDDNLRFDFSHLKLYTGTITRTGTAPDYTQFAFGSAISVIPDNLSIKLESGIADALRSAGKDYADKTRFAGQFKASLQFTVDLEDPAAGFSSVDDKELFFTNIASYINWCAVWDNGVQAGTGDNHMLIIDLPVMYRKDPKVDRKPESDSRVTLAYESLLDLSTTLYPFGIMQKNTAATV